MSNFRIDAELKNLRLIQGGKTEGSASAPIDICEDHECCDIHTRTRSEVKKVELSTWVTYFNTIFCNSCGWVLKKEEEHNTVIYPTQSVSVPKERVTYVETRRPALELYGGTDVMQDYYA